MVARITNPLQGSSPRRDRFPTLAVAASFAFGFLLSRLLESFGQTDSQFNDGTLARQGGPLSPPTATTDAGWGAVHVFHGPQLTNPAGSAKEQWFAQVGQDRIVLNLLGGADHGGGGSRFFVDLAANDAEVFSNTRALERRGWKGLCIEPNPVYWYGLARRPGCVTVAALVGQDVAPVRVKFRGVYGGIVGRMDEKLANRKKEPDAVEETRFTVPFAALLHKFRAPQIIDYLSLDVEGSEYLVMQGFPFQEYTIRLLTIERPSKDLKALLERHGYLFLKDLAWWGETLWAHESTGLSPSHSKVVEIQTEERNR